MRIEFSIDLAIRAASPSPALHRLAMTPFPTRGQLSSRLFPSRFDHLWGVCAEEPRPPVRRVQRTSLPYVRVRGGEE